MQRKRLSWLFTPTAEMLVWTAFTFISLIGLIGCLNGDRWVGVGLFSAMTVVYGIRAWKVYVGECDVRDRLVSILGHPGGTGRVVTTNTANTTNPVPTVARGSQYYRVHVSSARRHGRSQAAQQLQQLHSIAQSLGLAVSSIGVTATQMMQALQSMATAMGPVARKAGMMMPFLNFMYRDHKWATTAAFEVLVNRGQLDRDEAELLLDLLEDGAADIRLQEPSGVDVAGYVYGLRGWSISTKIVDDDDLPFVPPPWTPPYTPEYQPSRGVGPREDWCLSSLNDRIIWEPGVNTATCLVGLEDHVITHPDCGCGFWAFWRIEELDQMMPGQVQGIVRGWGNVLEASAGFRSEKSEIIGLLLPPNVDKMQEGELKQYQVLATKYRCPIYRYGEDRGWISYEYPPSIRITRNKSEDNQPYIPVWFPPGVEVRPLPQPSAWRPA